MLDTRPLITPRRYLCFCNYAVFSSLLIVLTIVAMGVLSYLVVPKRPKPVYIVVNFTDEEFENASAPSSSSVRREVVDAAEADRDLCSSRQCDREAERILDAINTSLGPCDDFYAYVCSAWMRKHEPGSLQDRTSVDYDILDAYSRFLVSVLGWKNSELPAAKTLFDACIEPPVGLFGELITMLFYMVGLQRWPYSESERVLPNEVSASVGSLYRVLGEDSLFHLAVVERPDSTTHPTISIAEPRLLVGRAEGGLPLADFVFLSKAHGILMDHLHKPMTTNVAAVEMDLARRAAAKRAADCTDPLSECMTTHIDHLPASRVLHWSLLVQEAFGEKMVALNQLVETPNFEYLVSFSDKVDQPLKKADLLNYLAFRICMTLSPLIEDAEVRHHLASIAYGRNPRFAEPLPVARYCLRLLDHFEPALVTLLAYDRSVIKLSWKVLQFLVLDHLNSTLFTFLGQDFSRRFSPEFSDHVARRLATIKWEPLMPLRFFNKTFRDKYFAGFTRENSSISLSSFVLFWLQRAVKRRRGPVETDDSEDLRTGWGHGFLRTWPALGSPFGHLEIPLPVFDPAMSTDAKLHAFHVARAGARIYRVVLGYVYSLAYGFFYNTSTSDPASVFENLRSCLQQSYTEMTAPAAGHGAIPSIEYEKTSASDMLDLMAAKLAFAAFEQWTRKEGLNFYFAKALQFDQKQLFFIYYGLSFCENVNPAATRGEGDAHSSARNRVNGPLRHMKEFADAFHCAEGSFMNPPKKCRA
ncbi:neprilysin-like [Dermacentor variabilis]|uniref:neprilysin-like n=1 Tax=Dermacentor variabilis TaxID=34621 RepID=UPI003F5B24CE